MTERTSKPVVVTVVGHVDHGKTTLLDAIRRSALTESEAGGITQNIGVYCASCGSRRIILVDTPGHGAFISTRNYGISIADVVVLIIGLDDITLPTCQDIMNTTIAHRKTTIIGLNKSDKFPSNVRLVKNSLRHLGASTGATSSVRNIIPLAAAKGIGIPRLLRLISGKIKSRTVPINVPAQGIVVDSSISAQSGIRSVLLVQLGTLYLGDILVINTNYSRVRTLRDELGGVIESAGPQVVPIILGLTAIPGRGDRFLSVSNERKAKEVLTARRNFISGTATGCCYDVAGLFTEKNYALGCFIIKARTSCMSEAVSQLLDDIGGKNNVELKVISRGIGNVSKGDIKLASITKSRIITFDTEETPELISLMKHNGVSYKNYSLIYEIASDIEQELKTLRLQKTSPVAVASAQIVRLFSHSVAEIILGCIVTSGTLKQHQNVRIFRGDKEVISCEIKALRRFKDQVSEVSQGNECGVAIVPRQDVELRAGDTLKTYDDGHD